MTQKNNNTKSSGASCCGDLDRYLSPRLFRALGDPTRVGLLVRLAEGGRPCTVGELADGLPIDVSVVSRHLAILREAGVIACVRQGREVRCTVRVREFARGLRELADALEACCGGLTDVALESRKIKGEPR
jgi:DNA-binding transcriptional ArsR family regulator